MTRAEEFYAFAVETFGSTAENPGERVLRFLEEAIELAQAAGITQNMIDATTYRVYGRPQGNIAQEFAQCMVTLEMAAMRLGVDLNTVADAELERFKSTPMQFWRDKFEAKRRAGIVLD